MYLRHVCIIVLKCTFSDNFIPKKCNLALIMYTDSHVLQTPRSNCHKKMYYNKEVISIFRRGL